MGHNFVCQKIKQAQGVRDLVQAGIKVAALLDRAVVPINREVTDRFKI